MGGKRSFMLAAAALFALGLVTQTAVAQDKKDPAAGESATIKLLTLMDTDKNGKVSKDEFMAYMAAEFDRLDVNKDGELDVGELKTLRYRPPHPGGSGSK